MHFRWKIWRLELLGALGVMGEMAASICNTEMDAGDFPR